MLDKGSPVPIYYQLEQFIKEQIEKGGLKYGEMIPSEREYAEQFNISRMTVRQAINNLVSDGLLVRQRGKGTFVQKPKIDQNLKGLTSFTEEMMERGLNPRTVLLKSDIIAPSDPLCKILNLNSDEKVYQFNRLRLADEEPMAFELVHIPVSLFPDFTADRAEGSIYRYIEEGCQQRITYAEQSVEAKAANQMISKILEIDQHSPVLEITRTAYLEGMIPFEHVITTFRSDRYQFKIDVNRV